MSRTGNFFAVSMVGVGELSNHKALFMDRNGKGDDIDIRNLRDKEEPRLVRTPETLFYEAFIQLRHLGFYGVSFQGRIVPPGQGLPGNIICVPRAPEKPSPRP